MGRLIGVNPDLLLLVWALIPKNSECAAIRLNQQSNNSTSITTGRKRNIRSFAYFCNTICNIQEIWSEIKRRPIEGCRDSAVS